MAQPWPKRGPSVAQAWPIRSPTRPWPRAARPTLFWTLTFAGRVPLHLFTVEQATALLGEVETMIAQARAELSQARDAAANLEDLSIIWGDAVSDAACEAHAEWLEFQNRLQAHGAAVNALLARFDEKGIHVKDIETGLVDFPARRGGDIVLLCYQAGEGSLRAWHTLTGGFAGRQALDTL